MQFLNDYSPESIEQFAISKLNVSNRENLDQILRIYHNWYFNRNRTQLHVNENPNEDEIDECLVIRHGGTDDEPVNIYISHKRDIERFIWRKQPIKKGGKLDGLTALQIGALTFDENFHHRYNEDKNPFSSKAGYLNEGGFYSQNIFKKLRSIINGSSYNSGNDLCQQIATVSGHLTKYGSVSDYELFEPIYRHAKQIEAQSLRKGVREFLSRLDPNAMKIAYRARVPQTMIYSWLMGHNDFEAEDSPYRSNWMAAKKMAKASPPESYRNRQSAGYAYPSLMVGFAFDRPNIQVNANLDEGMSVPEAILNALKLNEYGHRPIEYEQPKADALKWYLGRKPYFFDGFKEPVNASIYHILNDIEWLNAIPNEWRPRNRKEYKAYDRLYSDLGEFEHMIGRPKPQLMREFLSALNRPAGLPKFPHEAEPPKDDQPAKVELRSIFKAVSPVQELVTFHAGNDENDFALSGNMRDALSTIEKQIILPEIYRQLKAHGREKDCFIDEARNSPMLSISHGLMPYIFGKFTVLKIHTFSERWHRQAQRLETRTGRIDKDLKWHPIISSLTAPNGVKIHAMSSTSEIKEMGSTMNNCIGGYTYQCAIGKSHVLVLEAYDGSWKTNLQIREDGRGNNRTVINIQHSLKGNNENIPEEAKNAADWLIESINSRKINVDWKAVDAGREEHKKESVIIKIGFDPDSLEACDEGYLAWHGTMIDILPDDNRDLFLERTGLRSVIIQRVAQMVNNIKSYPRLDAA